MNGVMNTSNSPEAHALDGLLDFYAAAGVDCALEDDPVDRFLESTQAEALRAQRAQQVRSAPRIGSPHEGQSADPRRTAPSTLQRPSAPPQRPAAPASPAAGLAPAGQSAAQSLGTPPQSDDANEPTLHHLPDQPSRSFASLHGEEAIAAAKALAAAATTLTELRDALDQFSECGLSKTAKSLVFADGNPAAKIMFVGGSPEREEDIAGTPFVLVASSSSPTAAKRIKSQSIIFVWAAHWVCTQL